MANSTTSQKKSGQHLRRKARRLRQNIRTYRSVQKRRAKHAKSHGIAVESIAAIRWVSVPSSTK